MNHQFHFGNIHKSEKQDLKNNLHMHVFSSIIHNNEDMEALNVYL